MSIANQKGIVLNPTRITCDYELATINSFRAIFHFAHICRCFFHYAESLWRKIQELDLTRLVNSSNVHRSNSFSNEERKNAEDWFLAAVGLALIPPSLIEKTWTAAMDGKTLTHCSSVKFNDYMVSNYVDSTLSCYSIELWNVQDALVKDLPSTNNHIEDYNSRLGSLFLVHPHIFRVIECLRDEHLFQRHLAEQSKVHPIKRKQITEDINAQLRVLLNDHGIGEITDLEPAILCGRTLKIRLVK